MARERVGRAPQSSCTDDPSETSAKTALPLSPYLEKSAAKRKQEGADHPEELTSPCILWDRAWEH